MFGDFYFHYFNNIVEVERRLVQVWPTSVFVFGNRKSEIHCAQLDYAAGN